MDMDMDMDMDTDTGMDTDREGRCIASRPPVGGPGPLGPLCGPIGPGLPVGGRASRVSPPHLRPRHGRQTHDHSTGDSARALKEVRRRTFVKAPARAGLNDGNRLEGRGRADQGLCPLGPVEGDALSRAWTHTVDACAHGRQHGRGAAHEFTFPTRPPKQRAAHLQAAGNTTAAAAAAPGGGAAPRRGEEAARP